MGSMSALTATTTTTARDAFAATAPPLPPELWNFAVIAIICGLVGWIMRLTQHFLTFVDARFAAQSNAVLHLKGLGPSLLVLEHATVWHFEQLSRTKAQVTSATMANVHIPFEIPSASLAVSRTAPLGGTVGSSPSTGPSHEPPLRLSFTVRASAKCVVQVLWGVQTDALLEHSQRLASAQALASLRSPVRTDRVTSRIPVLRHLSPHSTKSVRQRAAELPTFLSRARRQNRRHRLDDDKNSDDVRADSSASAGASFSLEHVVRDGSFQSASPCERFDTWGDHEVVVEMPCSSVGPAEEIQSLLTEAESDIPTNAAQPCASSSAAMTTPEPRYSAIVLIGALEFFDESPGAKPRARDAIVCQCVAIDLLPTPVRAERFSPVIVKRFTVTLAGVYAQQEIFGRAETTGECVICLEGELAAVLLPCRHLCVCRACLREIDRCPICRAKFSTYACFADERKCASVVDAKSGDSVELKII